MKTDLPQPDTLVQLLESLQADAERLKTSHYFVLIDTMQLDTAQRQVLIEHSAATGRTYIYQGLYRGAGLERVDPLLLAMPVNDQDALLQMVHACAGTPALSFLSSAYELSELLAHVRRQLEATDGDGERYLLRWSDSRCLPVLYQAFDEQQRNQLMAGIHAWYFHGRDGHLQTINPTANSTLKADVAGYRLTAEQCRMIRLPSQADAHLTFIARHPERYGQLTGSLALHHHIALEAVRRAQSENSWSERNRQIVQQLHERELLV